MIVKAPVKVDCAHCGLPVPPGLFDPQQQEQFCCSGCSGAFHLIRGCGLESFYNMASSDEQSKTLRDRETSSVNFADYSSEAFIDKFARRTSNGEWKVKLAIEGIHCVACIWLIEKLPEILPGVLYARVNWSRGTVQVHWNATKVELSRIAETLHQLGYTPYPILENERSNRNRLENRKHLSRLGIAAALAGNNMIISAALYFGMFSHMSIEIAYLMRIASCIVGLAALLFPGRVFIQSAIAAVQTRTPHMDLPIAFALLIGTVAGTINVIRGSGEIYFDSLAVLIFLLLIGRYLQFRQQSFAADAVELLYRLTPKTARKTTGDNKYIDTLADLLRPDDIVEVRAGELFPADGLVISGNSLVDESLLTGESAPVRKTKNTTVFAGTLNQTSTVVFSATETGQNTRISKIAEMVEESGADRPKVVQWANKVGGYFVVGVSVLAVLTFLIWMGSGIELAINHTIALLIVACPCALALATPLSIAIALGRAARSGLMVKSGDVLQALQKPGMIWLDKTGTLTQGNLKVENWFGDRSCLPLVAAIERKSKHPVAQALVRYAEKDLETKQADLANANEQFGLGISGDIGNRRVVIGKLEFIENHQVQVSGKQLQFAALVSGEGLSPCWIAVDGEAVAIAAIGDAIRTEACHALGQLRAKGWEIGILSGDHQPLVSQVASRLKIKSEFAHGDVSPEDKLDVIRSSIQSGTTVMVGDGVNDCAALAAANVGIAVKGGAEASLTAAPVYLSKPGLNPILELFDVSASTDRIMKRNLAVSLIYNLTFAGFALAGFVNPLVAAVIMPVSSLSVVLLSLGAGNINKSKSGADQEN